MSNLSGSEVKSEAKEVGEDDEEENDGGFELPNLRPHIRVAAELA